MEFIDSIKQFEGPGGTFENWRLNNGLILRFWEDGMYYFIAFKDDYSNSYTKCIFNILNHPDNEIETRFVLFMPRKIRVEHKYFVKIIDLIEKLSVEELEPDELKE